MIRVTQVGYLFVDECDKTVAFRFERLLVSNNLAISVKVTQQIRISHDNQIMILSIFVFKALHNYFSKH